MFLEEQSDFWISRSLVALTLIMFFIWDIIMLSGFTMCLFYWTALVMQKLFSTKSHHVLQRSSFLRCSWFAWCGFLLWFPLCFCRWHLAHTHTHTHTHTHSELCVYCVIEVRKWLARLTSRSQDRHSWQRPAGLTDDRRVQLQATIQSWRESHPV